MDTKVDTKTITRNDKIKSTRRERFGVHVSPVIEQKFHSLFDSSIQQAPRATLQSPGIVASSREEVFGKEPGGEESETRSARYASSERRDEGRNSCTEAVAESACKQEIVQTNHHSWAQREVCRHAYAPA